MDSRIVVQVPQQRPSLAPNHLDASTAHSHHPSGVDCGFVDGLVARQGRDADDVELVGPRRQQDGHGVVMAGVAVEPHGLWRRGLSGRHWADGWCSRTLHVLSATRKRERLARCRWCHRADPTSKNKERKRERTSERTNERTKDSKKTARKTRKQKRHRFHHVHVAVTAGFLGGQGCARMCV